MHMKTGEMTAPRSVDEKQLKKSRAKQESQRSVLSFGGTSVARSNLAVFIVLSATSAAFLPRRLGPCLNTRALTTASIHLRRAGQHSKVLTLHWR